MLNNWWILTIVVGAIALAILITKITLDIIYYNTDKIDKFYCDKEEGLTAFTIIIIIISLGLLIFAITFTYSAKREFYEYEQQYTYIQDVVENTKEIPFANVEITEKILKYNEWLASARASQKTLGKWSKYYGIELEKLNYVFCS